MLTTIFVLAGATVAATLVTVSRAIGLRRVVRHATAFDIVFTILAALAFAGTLVGFAAAIVAGLIMALALSGMKAYYRAVDAAKAALRRRHEHKARSYSVPAGCDPAEYNENGWIYNQAPYIGGAA